VWNWRYPTAGVLVLLGVAVWIAPHPVPATATGSAAPVLADIRPIIEQRCVICHNAQVANKNIRLDSAEAIRANAQLMHQQVVVLKTMPMNNATGVTDAERAMLGRWFEAGARP
jgi:uncharacterized membrane protein